MDLTFLLNLLFPKANDFRDVVRAVGLDGPGAENPESERNPNVGAARVSR